MSENVSVVILPGCARSPKLNGFDWVLQRLAANIPVKREDIMRMGVGGLLVDTPVRPLPREAAVRPADCVRRRVSRGDCSGGRPVAPDGRRQQADA